MLQLNVTITPFSEVELVKSKSSLPKRWSSLALTICFLCLESEVLNSVLFAVWRHVLGTNDVVDGLDIALGKCITLSL